MIFYQNANPNSLSQVIKLISKLIKELQMVELLTIDEYQILLGEKINEKLYDCKSTKNSQIALCAKLILMQEQPLQPYYEMQIQIHEILYQNRINQNLVNVHLVRILKERNLIVIIMEKCDTTLQQIWDKKKKFNDSEIDEFFTQFLNGYRVLHQKNIIHRNIKPDSIEVKYINGKAIFKIANFGIAKLIQKDDDSCLEKIGTPAYAAPEISPIQQDLELSFCFNSIKTNEDQKSKIDVYSIALILYQMVHGNLPFEPSVIEIAKFLNHIKEQKLQLQGNSKYIQLIEEMLVYSPDQRIPFSKVFQKFEHELNNIGSQILGINRFHGISPFFSFGQISQNIISHRFPTVVNNNNNINYHNFSTINNCNNNIPQPQNKGQQNFQRVQTIQQNCFQFPNSLRQPLFLEMHNPKKELLASLKVLLHDYDGIVSDQTTQQLQAYIDSGDKIFQKENLQQLLEKVDHYTKILNFYYSLFSILNNPDIQNQHKISEQQQKDFIKKVANQQ